MALYCTHTDVLKPAADAGATSWAMVRFSAAALINGQPRGY
ncbi:MAG TPA: hypothetical protein VFG79_20750 [Solirubrobacter sp.]|nr:hypothetical protein [Solirubrobacter sp.]